MTRPTTRLLAPAILLQTLLAACASTPVTPPNSTTLAPADFATNTSAPTQSPETNTNPPIRRITREQATEGLDPVVSIVGPPTRPAPIPPGRNNPSLSATTPPNTQSDSQPTPDPNDITTQAPPITTQAPPRDPAQQQPRRLVVDQMVGQVNGEPVYAAEFLEPLDARFRATAQTLEPQEWLIRTAEAIEIELIDQIRDELLLAEFYTRLTTQQRQGVLFFIEQLRGDLVAGNLGSEERTNQRLLQEEGITLDEQIERLSEERFILDTLREEVGKSVSVSWRDVERYYRQNPEEFTTPGLARLNIIRVRADDAPTIDNVETAFIAGEPFNDVARRYSTFRADDAGQLDVPLNNRPLADAELLAIEELNNAARALNPGEQTTRLDAQNAAWWIRLAEVTPPTSTSLYEAQNDIRAKLYEQRLRVRELEYFNRLLSAASLDNIETMRNRLINFAIQRYLPPNTTLTANDLPPPQTPPPPPTPLKHSPSSRSPRLSISPSPTNTTPHRPNPKGPTQCPTPTTPATPSATATQRSHEKANGPASDQPPHSSKTPTRSPTPPNRNRAAAEAEEAAAAAAQQHSTQTRSQPPSATQTTNSHPSQTAQTWASPAATPPRSQTSNPAKPSSTSAAAADSTASSQDHASQTPATSSAST